MGIQTWFAAAWLASAAVCIGGQNARIGIDSNYANQLVCSGQHFSSGGKSVYNPVQPLIDAGVDAYRIRLWTGNAYESDYSLGNTQQNAEFVGGKQLKPLLTIFLSDQWSDMVKQPVPAIWKDLAGADKAAAIEKYAEVTIRQMVEAGIEPELYEIGNEIDFGVCGEFEKAWPHRVSIDYMRQNIWPKMLPLINAAEAGVRNVRPGAKFMLHLAQWQNADYCIAFWQYMIAHGVAVDELGLSYYPTSADRQEQRPLAFLAKQIDAIFAAVRRPVILCETAYPAAAKFRGQFSAWNKPVPGYPLDEAGQAKWLADLLAMVRTNPHLDGVYYWSPEWINGGLWDAFALFDSAGNARPAIKSFQPPGGQVAPPTTGPAIAATTPIQTVPIQTAPPAAAKGIHVYFGNLHSHTANSDGAGTPAEAYAYARDTAKLDFLAITDHNHILFGKDKVPYADIEPTYSGTVQTACIPAAKAATVDGKFVALYGEEFSSMSQGNHVNVFDVPNVIDVPNGKFDGLLDWMNAHRDTTGRPGVVMFNHPGLSYPLNAVGKKEYGRDDFGDDAGWIKKMGDVTSLIEILNGEPKGDTYAHDAPQIMDGYLRIFLRLGFHLAPTGDQDNHHKQWGTITDARTGILAPELTKTALLSAMRQRHVFASEDKNLRLIFTVNDHLCGDILATPGPTKVAFHLDDPDEPDAKYSIDAYSGAINGENAKIVQTVAVAHEQAAGMFDGFDGPPLTTPGQFVYFRITQTSKNGNVDHAWTAPVWYEKQ